MGGLQNQHPEIPHEHVLDHAHHHTLSCIHEGQPLADGIFTGPCNAGDVLVHDDGFRGVRRLRRGEEPPRKQAGSYDLEVVFRANGDVGPFRAALEAFLIPCVDRVPDLSGQRGHTGSRHAQHARQSFQFLVQLGVEGSHPLPRVKFLSENHEVECENLVPVEPQLSVAQFHEGPHHYSGASNEDCGKGQLTHYQRVHKPLPTSSCGATGVTVQNSDEVQPTDLRRRDRPEQ
jgi:hypothetical protein